MTSRTETAHALAARTLAARTLAARALAARTVAGLASALSLLALGLVGATAVPATAAPEAPVAADHRCTVELAEHLGPGAAARVLGCDHRDRGRVVVAFGDPATADRLAVLVPGAGTALTTLVAPPGEAPANGLPLDWALAAHAGPGTSVVLWVGYATPWGVGPAAATGATARAAAPALVEAVDDLQQLARSARARGHDPTGEAGVCFAAVGVSRVKEASASRPWGSRG